MIIIIIIIMLNKPSSLEHYKILCPMTHSNHD